MGKNQTVIEETESVIKFYTRETINIMNTQIALIDFPCHKEIVSLTHNSISSFSSIIIPRDIKKTKGKKDKKVKKNKKRKTTKKTIKDTKKDKKNKKDKNEKKRKSIK